MRQSRFTQTGIIYAVKQVEMGVPISASPRLVDIDLCLGQDPFRMHREIEEHTVVFIRLHPDDNVAVATGKLAQGASVRVLAESVAIREQIPFGHKFALEPIVRGAAIIKRGFNLQVQPSTTSGF